MTAGMHFTQKLSQKQPPINRKSPIYEIYNHDKLASSSRRKRTLRKDLGTYGSASTLV